MSGGSLALSVVIGAALSASFNRTFQSARQRTDALNHSLSNAEGCKPSLG